jgi:hypothetical protein
VRRVTGLPRIVVTLFAFGAVASACGLAGPLDGLGERSSDWVHEVEITAEVVAVVEAEPAAGNTVQAADVLWFNDDLEEQASGDEPEKVIAAVWARQVGSRFVQASRAEVAAAIPGIMFPEDIASEVRWITSQLVFEASTGTLDGETAAAFGLWQVEPYSITDGRVGVLRVGPASERIAPERSAVIAIVVPDGISLGWAEEGLRYELFCRSAVPEGMCSEIAASFRPLSDLLPTSDEA